MTSLPILVWMLSSCVLREFAPTGSDDQEMLLLDNWTHGDLHP